jgi:hypothetical protein
MVGHRAFNLRSCTDFSRHGQSLSQHAQLQDLCHSPCRSCWPNLLVRGTSGHIDGPLLPPQPSHRSTIPHMVANTNCTALHRSCCTWFPGCWTRTVLVKPASWHWCSLVHPRHGTSPWWFHHPSMGEEQGALQDSNEIDGMYTTRRD